MAVHETGGGLIFLCPIREDMMLTTHVLLGMALALPVLAVAPDLGPAALVAGAFGGALPDADMYVGHRRTLHFPVYFVALAVPTAALAAVFATPATVAIAVGLLAAALHCWMDVLGGGLELEPWKATSERAVYDHYRGRWLRPRRWIGYDGSPGDLLLALGVGVPLWAVLDGRFATLVVALLAISVVYAAARKWLVTLAPYIVKLAPDAAAPILPDRYDES